MTTRYRITVRADDIELRGYIDSMNRVREIARALEPTGAMVVASISDDQPGLPDDLAGKIAEMHSKAGRE